jgi:FdhD protein
MHETDDSQRTLSISEVTPDGERSGDDIVAVEEPMEIRVAFGSGPARTARSLSVTMRTPGHDFELAAGFLFTEGLLSDPRQVRGIDFCGPNAPGRSTSNIVRVDLAPDVPLDLERLQRNFYTTSSCGICGKTSLDALQVQGLTPLRSEGPRLSRQVIHRLPEALRSAQPVFERTGGLHAAALATEAGDLLDVCEDVGRHNAVDKLIGRRFLDGEIPLSDRVMVVSGRASFEILQKALVAGIPVIVAVGAPSSLAVEMAESFGMTLIGFASDRRFNVYSGGRRVGD